MNDNTTIVFTSSIYKLQHLLVNYIEIPEHIIQKLGGGLTKRLLCTLNNSITFQCGLMALGNGSAYITINAKRMKQLGVSLGDTVNVSLVKDQSQYGMDMPEELAEWLLQDDEGKRRFDLLTPGKKRYIIYYLGMIKNKQLRLDRTMLIIENLKKTKIGNESFREILGKTM